ncbi:C2H2-like zinc finger protein [Raphanus sativus]|uniref:Zinc finger protein SHOOT GRAVITROPISM 5 n=1 Tax=Raphanus sativus TaxID=3726 RepID=A0A6J0LXZ3_RAPSA|nr:zinc finger protein SHOOT GRAVITROPISM 5 [Raphanus sativus]KAJ4910488.1 C2H2-like zinc finger protein [Raphanus sativus]
MAEQQDHHKELQLLPSPPSTESPVRKLRATVITTDHHHSSSMIHQDLDLKLSISLSTIPTATVEHLSDGGGGGGGVEDLKWQAAEQIRLAAIEKAYAERVRELTRREMEMAQAEFARARVIWQKAREGVERAERMKERSMTKIDTTCLEITCHSCRQRFRP